MLWIVTGIAVLYYAIGYVLTARANSFRRDNASREVEDLWNPALFTRDGERARRRAWTYWYLGWPILLVVLVAIGRLGGGQ
jgi:hypothetical protein